MLRRLVGIAAIAAGFWLVWQPAWSSLPPMPSSAGWPTWLAGLVSPRHAGAVAVPSPGVLPAEPDSPAPMAAPPVRLQIPRLSLDAAVEPVGVGLDNTMGVPVSVRDVGWLSSGPMPGATGNAVLDGHVDDVAGRPAVFWTLGRLQAGDVITVRTAGAGLLYVVTAVAKYPLAAFPRTDVFGPSPLARLNLITCAGTWDRWRHVYSERLVVYSRLLKVLGQRPGWRPS